MFLDDQLQDAFRNSTIVWNVKKDVQRTLSKKITLQTKSMIKPVFPKKIKEGILFKEGFLKWEQLKVKLCGQKLVYVTTDDQPRGNINFKNQNFMIQKVPPNKSAQKFIISAVKRDGELHQHKFIFKAQSQHQSQEWYHFIKNIIQESEGRKLKRSYLSQIQNFWYYDSIHAVDFENEVLMGDLMLFSNRAIFGQILQMIALNDFDHVGVVIKDRQNQAYLYQACGNMGTGLISFKNLLYYQVYKSVKKIVFRRVNFSRTGIQKKAQIFLKETIGKRYSITLGKLLGFGDSIISKESKDAAEKTDKDFFCSELVAYFYKKLQLLPMEIKSAKYWPSSFSSKQKLQWQNGSSIGPETIICFDEQECRNYAKGK